MASTDKYIFDFGEKFDDFLSTLEDSLDIELEVFPDVIVFRIQVPWIHYLLQCLVQPNYRCSFAA
jgi:hypothetical protein